jgi:predicted PurR-regulated permease PerM
MRLDITYKSIFRVLLIVVGLWLLYQVFEVIAVIFFGIIISSAIAPAVDSLHKEGVPRILGSVLIYFLVLAVLSLIIYILLPPTISQIAKLSTQLPGLLSDYLGALSLPADFFAQFRETLTSASSNIIGWLVGLLGGIGNIVFVFFISFYLTVEDKGIKRFLENSVPATHHNYILNLISRSQSTLSQWLKAQLILMVSVGVLTSLALLALGIPNALALGALAGLLEIVPFAGPIIAAIPALVFAFSISPLKALVVFVTFAIIQQIESQVFTPIIMKRAFHINPVLVLVALFIGAKLGGIVGIIASVPLLALGLEFSKDYYAKSVKSE